MKKNILKYFLMLAVLLLASGCYQLNEPTSGDLAMRVTIPADRLEASGPSRAPSNTGEYWVVGLVVDAAFEGDLKELLRIYDIQDADVGAIDDYRDSDADTILEDMLQKGAVRFDGGRFFFQFKIDVSDSETDEYSGDFVLSGIPAGKEYFLNIFVMDREISSIDDFDDDPILVMDARYFDPAVSGSAEGTESLTRAGWYYFYDWDTSYDGSTLSLTYAVPWVVNGTAVSNQPFEVEAGETATVDILLKQNDDYVYTGL